MGLGLVVGGMVAAWWGAEGSWQLGQCLLDQPVLWGHLKNLCQLLCNIHNLGQDCKVVCQGHHRAKPRDLDPWGSPSQAQLLQPLAKHTHSHPHGVLSPWQLVVEVGKE